MNPAFAQMYAQVVEGITAVTCRTCGERKPREAFYAKLSSKLGIRNECKQCQCLRSKIWKSKNHDKKRESDRKWKEQNRGRLAIWRQQNPHINQKSAKTRRRRLNEDEEYHRHYYQMRSKRHNERMKTDVQYKIRGQLRSRFKKVLRKARISKTNHVLTLLGLSLDNFTKYIESQFKPGMTWKNHDLKGWHLDHIRPLASFDLTKEEDQRQAFHYTNYQPLWASENLSKGAKFVLP